MCSRSFRAEGLRCAQPDGGIRRRRLGRHGAPGSLTRPGEPGDAGQFYAGLDVRPLDMTAGLSADDP
jgi:hypothetical protein